MASVRVTNWVRATVHQAESCWYDTTRWPEWVDELTTIVEVTDPWPAAGGSVVWQSGPAGRGRVTERVITYEPLRGQEVKIEDQSITGEQRVSFTPERGGVEISLELDYEIKRRNPLTRLIDALFIRRLIAGSIQRTLSRFGAELDAAVGEGAR